MLYAYSLTNQTVAAGDAVTFNINDINSCHCIDHSPGSAMINIYAPGTYIISFNADVTSASTGELQFILQNKTTAVNGAKASTTVETANNVMNLEFTAAIKVFPSCPAIDNTAQLTILNNSSIAALISNAAITVRKL